MHLLEEIHGNISSQFLSEEIMKAKIDLYDFYKYVMSCWDQIPKDFQLVLMFKIMKEANKLSKTDKLEFEVWRDEYDKKLAKEKKELKKKQKQEISKGNASHPYYEQVMKYRKQGKTYKEIANTIGYSYQTIYNIVNA
jgi:DNA-binding NarL/FixJ family response regulator